MRGHSVVNLRSEIEQLTPALRRLAHSLVAGGDAVSADAGDDLVHETLLRALRFDSPANGIGTRHWLYAIMVGINRQRSHASASAEENRRSHGQNLLQRQNTRYTNPLPPDFVPSPGAYKSHPFRTGTQDNPGDMFKVLALEEREALMLVVLEGLSYSQSAAILGLPRPTLIARLARARAKMTTRMHRASPHRTGESRTHLRLIK